MSLTNTTDPRKTMYFPKFDWPRIENPYLSYPITEQVIENVIKREQIAINQIKDALINNKDDIAGLIIEPIQGEGGDNFFRCQFLQMLRDLCLTKSSSLTNLAFISMRMLRYLFTLSTFAIIYIR